MTEREEFELVAKAAGINTEIYSPYAPMEPDESLVWNPKTDDGDCLGLAVDLWVTVYIFEHYARAIYDYDDMQVTGTETYFSAYPDKYAAVRAAVLEVAVEVAKKREQIMQKQMIKQWEEEQQQESQYIEVTREMANDAGFPEMAGQIIKW